MNADFVRDFFQLYGKLMPELEMNINQDNESRIRSIIRKLELEFVLFKRKLYKEFEKNDK